TKFSDLSISQSGADSVISFSFGTLTLQNVNAGTLSAGDFLFTTGATITGTSGNDTITPSATVAGQPFPTSFGDTINALAGNDTIDGGVGADTMSGGLGSDTYYVDNLSDVVIENAGEGTDLVNVKVSGYTLPANVENGTIAVTTGATLTGNTD